MSRSFGEYFDDQRDRIVKAMQNKNTQQNIEWRERYDERERKKKMGVKEDSNVKKVIEQLKERENRGIQKYGVNTDRTDLNILEWLQHLQEELMDGTVYIEKLKTEMKKQ